ncbi:MAG TPA: hypothetical protein VLU47_02290 [Blastocatellia bacterium]|nr:hypothetical protein [Blastocatellia bacterium]
MIAGFWAPNLSRCCQQKPPAFILRRQGRPDFVGALHDDAGELGNSIAAGRSERDGGEFSTPCGEAGSIADARLSAFDSTRVPMKRKGSRGAVYRAIANTTARHKKNAPAVRTRSCLNLGEHLRHSKPSTAKLALFVLMGSPQDEQNRVRRIDRTPVRKVSTGASIGSNRDR